MIAIANDFHTAGQSVPVTTLCRVLGLPRSTAYYKLKSEPQERPCDPELTGMIYAIIQEHPAFGVRRVWAWLRYQLVTLVNCKTVHRIMRLNGWTIRQRRAGQRPRVEAFPSIAVRPNQQWATDIAMVKFQQAPRLAAFLENKLEAVLPLVSHLREAGSAERLGPVEVWPLILPHLMLCGFRAQFNE